ncbi:hypothetical protein MMC11_008132 [Xylographa trunciseda]|nr:hypothetical protein [Xylographa trunciseda]
MDVAAGSIAFASIAIQLGQSFVTLYQFWESIKETPVDVSTVVQDLKLLAAILHQIELNEQKYGQDPEVTDVLKSCIAKVDTLRNLVEELEPGFASKHRLQRKWNALKAVLKNDKVEKFRKSLEETKTTMLLARSLSQERLQSIRFQSSEEKLSTIVSTLGSLQLQQCSRTITTTSAEYRDGDEQWTALRFEIKRMASEMSNPVYRAGFEHAMDYSLRQILHNNSTVKNDHPFSDEDDEKILECISPDMPGISYQRTHQQRSSYQYSNENVFGRVAVQSTTILKRSEIDLEEENGENRQLYEHRMTIRVQPAWWLTRIGFNRGLQVAFTQATSKSLNISLDPFRLVPDDALIFEFCYTGNIDGVRRLLLRGEASARDADLSGRTPLHIAASGCYTELSRLLIDAGADKAAESTTGTPLSIVAKSDRYVHYQQKIETLRLLSDELDVWADDVTFLSKLLASRVPTHLKLTGNGPIAAWAANYYFSIFKSSLGMFVSNFYFYDSTAQEAIFNTIFTLRDFEENEFVIFASVVYAEVDSIQFLLNKGINPHTVAAFNYAYNEGDSITYVAMWNSITFHVWCTALKKLGTNFEDFVEVELKLAPTEEAGWTTKSLLNLFNREVVVHDSREAACSICSSKWELFEPAWRIELDTIRRTEDWNNDALQVSKRWEDNVRWQDVPYELICYDCLGELIENDYTPFSPCPKCGSKARWSNCCCICTFKFGHEDDEDDGFSPFKLF